MEAFLNYLQYEKRVSAHTVTAYRTDLEQFAAYLQKEFGENAVDILHDMIENKSAGRSIVLKPTLVPGGSVLK